MASSALQQVFAFGPARRDHIPATRIMISVGLPLGILVLLGRPDLTIYAAFGAFTSLYNRNELLKMRMMHQLQSGFLIVGSVGVGILLSASGASSWGVIVGGSIVAAITTLGGIYWGLRPPGPLFYIFASAAIGSIPYQGHGWLAFGIALASSLLSVALSLLGYALGEGRGELVSPPVPHHGLTFIEICKRSAIYGAAAFVAGAAGELAGISHAYWAMVASAAVLVGPSATVRYLRAAQRVIGTLGGVLITAFFVSMHPDPWHVVVLVVAAQFIGEIFVLRNYAFTMLFITPVAMFMIHLVKPFTSYELLTDRFLETAIGAAIGIIAVLVTPSPEYHNQNTTAIPVVRAARKFKR